MVVSLQIKVPKAPIILLFREILFQNFALVDYKIKESKLLEYLNINYVKISLYLDFSISEKFQYHILNVT